MILELFFGFFKFNVRASWREKGEVAIEDWFLDLFLLPYMFRHAYLL
jgi:hypothetical protein